jgi:hypothetical protein
MKEKKNKETSKVSKTVSNFWTKILKPFLGGLWIFIRVLSVIALFGVYLYIFSDLVIRGITELSAAYLAGGIGGYILIGIVALLLIYDYLYQNNRDSQTKVIVKEYNPFPSAEFRLMRDMDELSKRIYSLKYDLKLSGLSWKIDDVHREVKDLARSLKQ